jgi:hypothetical protein
MFCQIKRATERRMATKKESSGDMAGRREGRAVGTMRDRVLGPQAWGREADRRLKGVAGRALSGGHVKIREVADGFRMSRVQLAATAGLSRDTVYKPARLDGPKAQNRMREMLEILARISDWAGGDDQAMAWYRAQPLPEFGGRTAESLVKEGRATDVRDYLDYIALGNYS